MWGGGSPNGFADTASWGRHRLPPGGTPGAAGGRRGLGRSDRAGEVPSRAWSDKCPKPKVPNALIYWPNADLGRLSDI